jgi:hypothetical protein
MKNISLVVYQTEDQVMAKGNNSQGKEKKKPKKDPKAAPVKPAPPAKKK